MNINSNFITNDMYFLLKGSNSFELMLSQSAGTKENTGESTTTQA